MTTMISTNFLKTGQGLGISAGMRVVMPGHAPMNTIQRSASTSTVQPNYYIAHSGLGLCWGWTPSGLVTIACETEAERAANEISREFLVDASNAFTAPTNGFLRLYGNPVVPNAEYKFPVITYNETLIDGKQKYYLSQLFDNGQFQEMFPGTKEFWTDEGSSWIILEAPAAFPWTATSKPFSVSPSVIGIFCQTADTNVRYRIEF